MKVSITIVGSGIVGFGFGKALSTWGNDVFFYDINVKRLEEIKQAGYNIIKDLHKAAEMTDYFFICVPTPTDVNGNFDRKYLDKSLTELGEALKYIRNAEKNIIIKSTCLPQTTRNFVVPKLMQYCGERIGKEVQIAFNPEFLRAKYAFEDSLQPIRTIIGEDHPQSDIGNHLEEMFQPVKHYPFFRVSYEEAELIKYSANLFYATRISFMNQIYLIAKSLHIGSQSVVNALLVENYKDHGKKHGKAFGGACLPKDLQAMISYCKEHSIPTDLLSSVQTINEVIFDMNGSWEQPKNLSNPNNGD